LPILGVKRAENDTAHQKSEENFHNSLVYNYCLGAFIGYGLLSSYKTDVLSYQYLFALIKCIIFKILKNKIQQNKITYIIVFTIIKLD